MKKYLILLAGVLALAGCGSDAPEAVEHSPKLLSIIPKAGYPGTEAVISGYWFSDDAVVTVGGTPATVTATTIDRITVVMPSLDLGAYPVSVTTGGKTVEGLSFRYAEPVEPEKLAVWSYSPNHGIEGDEVTISGQLFSNKKERNSVTINDKAVEIVSANDVKLVVVLPDNEPGQYPFIVTVDGESVTGPMFTYDKKPELTVTSISPSSGTAGDVLTINGLCFSEVASENIVTLNGVRAEVAEAATTRLQVVVPENPKGAYPVVVTVGDKTVTGPSFLYVQKTLTYTVRTLAGTAGRNPTTTESVDGALSTAKWRLPRGLVWLPDGRIASFDEGTNVIRFIDLAKGTVTTTQAGHKLLNAPWRGCVKDGWLYLVSKGNGNILRYNLSTDNVEKLAPTFSGKSPMDIQFDAAGNAYILVRDEKALYKYPAGDFSAQETLLAFDDKPQSMALLPDGNFVVATDGCQLLSVTLDGTATVIAGIKGAKAVDDGEPGAPLTAKFGLNLWGMAVDAEGVIYVTDIGNHVLRRVAPGENGYADALVQTIAGTAGKAGKTDGDGSVALFSAPHGIIVHPDGNKLYLSDSNNSLIREITIQ